MRRYIYDNIKSLAACMLLAAMAAGCAHDDDAGMQDGGATGMKATSYVSLSFVSQATSGTRANPTGGESGDGTEKGQDYENRITSAVAFFFNGTDGINSRANTQIQEYVLFNSFSPADGTDGTPQGVDRVYTAVSQPVELENGTYDVLVVANPGASGWWEDVNSLTLGDVRDHIMQEAWTEASSGYSNFLMSSESDVKITLDSNPEDEPATADVYVERMAARVDYMAQASYTCTDPNYTGATVEITGAALVNNLTAGSYLMKRVAGDVGGTDLSYLGDETADASTGAATNYVLDPWTAVKTSVNNSFTVGGSTVTAAGLYGTYFNEASENPNWWSEYATAGTTVSDGTDNWQRIGYTLENTTAAAESGKKYSTGVVFKAKFHPTGVENYTDGATFFALGSHLFASMEKMMSYVYGADFAAFDANIDACTTWEDLKGFASTLLDNDPSGYKAFLEGQDVAQDFATVKESLKWKAYMLSECGYSAELSADGKYTVKLDQLAQSDQSASSAPSTASLLRPFGTRVYEDATCYYTWWLRHANDGNDDANGIMEYAVVRNNIYKLTVSSIYSLGGYIPDDDENIVLDVYVNDWLMLPQETLPM